jgi:hypothetical protein
MLKIIDYAIQHRFVVGSESLRMLFDSNAEYYKYNMLDRNIDYPIGRDNPLERYFPEVNEECDVVKPYITTTSPCGWVRCLVLNITNNGVYTVKYANHSDVNVLKDKPHFAPLGSRCKDHEWRMNLKVGDNLDA